MSFVLSRKISSVGPSPRCMPIFGRNHVLGPKSSVQLSDFILTKHVNSLGLQNFLPSACKISEILCTAAHVLTLQNCAWHRALQQPGSGQHGVVCAGSCLPPPASAPRSSRWARPPVGGHVGSTGLCPPSSQPPNPPSAPRPTCL